MSKRSVVVAVGIAAVMVGGLLLLPRIAGPRLVAATDRAAPGATHPILDTLPAARRAPSVPRFHVQPSAGPSEEAYARSARMAAFARAKYREDKRQRLLDELGIPDDDAQAYDDLAASFNESFARYAGAAIDRLVALAASAPDSDARRAAQAEARAAIAQAFEDGAAGLDKIRRRSAPARPLPPIEMFDDAASLKFHQYARTVGKPIAMPTETQIRAYQARRPR